MKHRAEHLNHRYAVCRPWCMAGLPKHERFFGLTGQLVNSDGDYLRSPTRRICASSSQTSFRASPPPSGGWLQRPDLKPRWMPSLFDDPSAYSRHANALLRSHQDSHVSSLPENLWYILAVAAGRRATRAHHTRKTAGAWHLPIFVARERHHTILFSTR